MKFETVELVELEQQPQTPMSALLVADAWVRAQGSPLPSPLEFIRLYNEHENGEIVATAAPTTKLTVKDLLPGTKLRSGSSEVEVLRVLPTENEVVYRVRNELKRTPSDKFVQLANRQGYRKKWDLPSFLRGLKGMLKPILTAIPLMWVLKLIVNAVRKKPLKFSGTPKKEKL